MRWYQICAKDTWTAKSSWWFWAIKHELLSVVNSYYCLTSCIVEFWLYCATVRVAIPALWSSYSLGLYCRAQAKRFKSPIRYRGPTSSNFWPLGYISFVHQHWINFSLHKWTLQEPQVCLIDIHCYRTTYVQIMVTSMEIMWNEETTAPSSRNLESWTTSIRSVNDVNCSWPPLNSSIINLDKVLYNIKWMDVLQVTT